MSRRFDSCHLVPALLAFALLTPVSTASAAEEAAESPLRAGAWALQFSIGEDFTLNSFGGAALAVKHHSSANGAWRAAVGLTLADYALDRTYESPDTTLTELWEEDADRQSIGIEIDRLHYFGSGPAVRPYLGYGPQASWSRDEVSGPAQERESSGWSAGVGGLLGVEYRAASALGVHAEYRYSLYYSSRTQETRTIPSPTVERFEISTWQLASSGVRFGLSAYF